MMKQSGGDSTACGSLEDECFYKLGTSELLKLLLRPVDGTVTTEKGGDSVPEEAGQHKTRSNQSLTSLLAGENGRMRDEEVLPQVPLDDDTMDFLLAETHRGLFIESPSSSSESLSPEVEFASNLLDLDEENGNRRSDCGSVVRGDDEDDGMVLVPSGES